MLQTGIVLAEEGLVRGNMARYKTVLGKSELDMKELPNTNQQYNIFVIENFLKFRAKNISVIYTLPLFLVTCTHQLVQEF